MSNFYKYIGQGMARPVTLVGGAAQLSTGLENIRQAIRDILSTPKGSRLFVPEYGSRLHEMMFEQNSEILIPLFRQFIKDAITQWEGRVRFNDVHFEIESESIACSISYTIIATNEVDSFVFPYYREIKY